MHIVEKGKILEAGIAINTNRVYYLTFW